jgi:hypothetical protein
MVYKPKTKGHLAENPPLNFDNLLRFFLVRGVRSHPFDGKTFPMEVVIK